MNLNLYGHAKNWLMVDCGATFNVPLDPEKDNDFSVKRHDVVVPDASFIIENKDALCGIVITHAHEDHLGALMHIWPQLDNCPIYTTRFTAEVIRRKFYRADLFYELPIVEVRTGDILDIGPFTLRWLSITHSIPEPQALLITTSLGSVFHTADWKIDMQPVIGNKFKPSRFKALSKENILSMVCDSTNANRAGFSVSEKECEYGLHQLIQKANGRVIVTCFASNIARLLTLFKIARETGRYVCLFGQSLDNMISIARATDNWPDDYHPIPKRHIGYLPAREVLIIATGSQGESKAALSRMADGTHRDCDLEKGDTVIFSSIVIPGNEKPILKLVEKLKNQDVTVYQSENCEYRIHASGHPNSEDLAQMYQWVRPKSVIPTHGESLHMTANAAIAKRVGVETQMVGVNGDLFELAPNYQKRNQVVKTGRIPI
ncbi:ribonuclease J [Glaciecola sp. 1036]|uniref:ribonuclease J n=1 Tax=Alteromonadaceae TaxID=72275 RepID=UPI003D08F1E2